MSFKTSSKIRQYYTEIVIFKFSIQIHLFQKLPPKFDSQVHPHRYTNDDRPINLVFLRPTVVSFALVCVVFQRSIISFTHHSPNKKHAAHCFIMLMMLICIHCGLRARGPYGLCIAAARIQQAISQNPVRIVLFSIDCHIVLTRSGSNGFDMHYTSCVYI